MNAPETVTAATDRLAAIAAGEVVPAEIHPELAGGDPVLDVDDFNLWYGDARALYDIAMTVPKGKVTALIGPSGCGKSTLLRSVNRMNDLIDTVRITGVDEPAGRQHLRQGRGRHRTAPAHGHGLPEVEPLPHEHPRERGLRPAHQRRAQQGRPGGEVCERALRGAALWDEVKDRLDESALGMSGGQQQRLCIARAIAAEPEVLLMDEPCSALDPIATTRVEELILELRGEYTVLIVTHNMQQASRVSDYTAFMYLAGR